MRRLGLALAMACAPCTVLLAMTAPATAGPLLGSDFGSTIATATIYDIDPTTGAATNPRATGLNGLVDIAFHPNTGVLYGITTTVGNPAGSELFTIDPITGATTLVGATGLSDVFEGDLAFDPTTNFLYGVQNLSLPSTLSRELFTINLTTGTANVIGSIATFGDMSAMAFDSSGQLYVVDSVGENESLLLRVDKSTASLQSSTAMNINLGPRAGMDVDPVTGTFYVADGDVSGTDNLYTLNTATGELTLVGPTGLTNGLAGLAFQPTDPAAVPEPTSVCLIALGGLTLLGYRRRRRR